MQDTARRNRGGIGFLRCVRLGHAWEEEDDGDADKWAWHGSDTERGEGRATAGERWPTDSWAGPLRLAGDKLGARAVEAKWASGLLG
jgi:hypothetical protein